MCCHLMFLPLSQGGILPLFLLKLYCASYILATAEKMGISTVTFNLIIRL